jgi:hypothetical protein
MLFIYALGMLFVAGMLLAGDIKSEFGPLGHTLLVILWVLLWPLTLGLLVADHFKLNLRSGK